MSSSRVDHIILGHDGSEGADNACRWLAGFAAEMGAEVMVVQGYDPLGELGKAKPPVDLAALEQEAKVQLEERVGAFFRPAGVAFKVVLVEDHGATALARVAGEEEVDLIVVGSHGRTGWRERVLGRIAMRLPNEAPCPVVIVPQPSS